MSTAQALDETVIQPDVNALRAELIQGVALDCVLYDAEDLRPYECDGLAAYRQVPLMVVLPETIEQVQHVMRVCHSRKVAERMHERNWVPGLLQRPKALHRMMSMLHVPAMPDYLADLAWAVEAVRGDNGQDAKIKAEY